LKINSFITSAIERTVFFLTDGQRECMMICQTS